MFADRENRVTDGRPSRDPMGVGTRSPLHSATPRAALKRESS